ncbi:PIN domain-like protein, partial [Rickenella mellea]
WQVLKPAAETTTFMEFVAEGFKTVKPRKGLVVGIDASLWFFQVQNPFLSGHWNAGHSPELRTVFHRLAFLSTLPLTPLFVFDGPQRPAIKRGTRTLGPEHWMAPVFRNFISAFGFDSHVAPGEAEAELAMLNRVGIIDAVFTEDVDTLIFGAHTHASNPCSALAHAHQQASTSNKRDHMEISIYRSARILEHPDVRLSTGGLVMMALLCGGDYDQGLVGCGPSVAHPLSTSDLADNLHQAALAPDVTAHQLVDALIDWREDLQHQLRDNPQHLLPRRYPALSQLIPFSFPLPSILRLYIAPLTSSSPLPPGSPLLSLGQQHLDITTLAALCETHFCWGLTEGVANALRSSVWPAAVSRTMQDSI